MICRLTPDNEQFLDQAVAQGMFSSREEAINKALAILREKQQTLPVENRGERRRESTEQWIARIRAWSDCHPGVESFVDDSRESIY